MPKSDETIQQFFEQSRTDWRRIEAGVLALASRAASETGGSPSLGQLTEMLPTVFKQVQGKLSLCERVCMELASSRH